jgi:di/tricarboxylate transporter
MWDQYIVFGVIVLALVLFATGRFRHDVVAIICLMILGLTGVVGADDLYTGFSNPAVVTVAAVLVLGAGLRSTGVVDVMGRVLSKIGGSVSIEVLVMSLAVCVLSAFMNNIGALAVLMPVGIQMARARGRSPGYLLMPMAFASLLGGTTTLIGTPPNLLLSAFRDDATGEPFALFDFAWVGVPIALAGLLYVAFIGWRLLPERNAEDASDIALDVRDYVAEFAVPERSDLNGMTIGSFQRRHPYVQVLQIVRGPHVIHAPADARVLRQGDRVSVEGTDQDVERLLDATDAVSVSAEDHPEANREAAKLLVNVEVVVGSRSMLRGRSAADVGLRDRYRTNLLAVSRQGRRLVRRPTEMRLLAGDVLLVSMERPRIEPTLATLGCFPLRVRNRELKRRRAIPAIAIFLAAIVVVVGGWLPVQVAFVAAAVLMVLTGVLPLKDVYSSIDWPVIVLLGAMLPVGLALESSGGAETIASLLGASAGHLPTWAMLAVLYVVTATLTDIVNNAAAVVLMAPIALSLADQVAAAPDAVLMTIAIAASCAFLTPIGHQSNTLVMGPGGYVFTDYVRMGFGLQLVVGVVAIPVIMMVWA